MKAIRTNIFLLAVLLVAVWNSAKAAGHGATPELEKALLAEDWPKVSELLAKVDTSTPSPTLRLIKGHACLALNKNNDALRLFLASTGTEDIAAWELWTKSFSTSHPKSVVTEYFKGDSLARSRSWNGALTAFNSALKSNPQHSLTLNARGVCLALAGDWNKALEDFNSATTASPAFADAWHNRGAMYIQRSTGAKGALSAFDTALKHSADFALAKMGRACALFGAGKWSDAEAELQACQSQSDVGDVVTINLALVWDARLAGAAKQLASNDPGAGVSLNVDAKTRAMSANQELQQINQKIAQSSGGAARSSGWSGFLNDLSKSLDVGAKLAGFSSRKDLALVLGLGSRISSDASSFSANKANEYRNQASGYERQWQSGIKSMMETSYREHPGSPQAKAFERLYVPGSGGSQPGGVTTDLSGAHVDSGSWGVSVPYGILYTGVHVPEMSKNTTTADEIPSK